MPPIQFKLTSSTGITRVAAFNEAPNWDALAAKLHSLFGIPHESVAVSYVDNECDEITLSSQEELGDYYAFAHNGDVIKFAVVDLLSPRDNILIAPANRTNSDQDTFGNDNFELLDPDWQSLPKVSPEDITLHENENDHTNPFEFLSRDVSGFDFRNPTVDIAEIEDVTFKTIDKGKAKASAEEILSNSGEDPDNSLTYLDIPPTVASSGDIESEPLSQSTPKATVTAIDSKDASLPVESTTEDPPLPSLDNPPASATLSNDIATLINAFTQAVRAHPELSEGVGNILRNVTNGSYWQDHRERLSRAARDLQDDISQPNVEAEASKRLVDSINQMLRSFSVGGSPPTTNDRDAEKVNEPEPSVPTVSADAVDTYPPTEDSRLKSAPWSSHWTSGSHMHRSGGRPHWGPSAQHPPIPQTWPHFTPPIPPPIPPPPPPPPSHHVSFGINRFPPPPPPHPVFGMNAISSPPFNGYLNPPISIQPFSQRSSRPSAPPQQTSTSGPFDRAFVPEEGNTRASMRTNMEEAKRAHKNKEDMHHMNRGVLKSKKVHVPPTTEQNGAQASTTRNDSNATLVPESVWGTSRVNAPRRHNTHLGHSHRPEDQRRRAEKSIIRRLADMGFTNMSYPELTGMVQNCIPDNGLVSKEAEDDIVTTLLEGLLATAPGSPSAPNRDLDPPGGWPARGHDTLD